MTKIYQVKYIGNVIGVLTITTNAIKEVHWIIFQKKITHEEDLVRIDLFSTSYTYWQYPAEILDDTIVTDVLNRTIYNCRFNGLANYSYEVVQ
jgi:hypothetical protein